MEINRFPKNSQIIILGVCLATATVAASVIISQAMIKIIKFSNEVINVTGSAEKKINSDYTVWRSGFSRRDPQMTVAFKKLQEDLKGVNAYLGAKGIRPEEIIVSQIDTKVLYKKNQKGNDTNEIEAYFLSQGLEVRSHDVAGVTIVSRESTELINQGIEFISYAPEYFYQKLAEATKDAKKRAEQMAASGQPHRRHPLRENGSVSNHARQFL